MPGEVWPINWYGAELLPWWSRRQAVGRQERTTTVDREVQERLAAIRRRLARATPGPWRAQRSGRICDPEGIPVAQTPTTTELAEPVRQDLVDAELIAHLPEDLAWLLALVERLASEDPTCE
jgi:hypothetical protein